MFIFVFISLGMNIFTSFFVLLLLLYKNMPSNAEHIPRIGNHFIFSVSSSLCFMHLFISRSGAYYCLNMGMIATSTFLCTIVVHIYFRGSGPMPTVLRKVEFIRIRNDYFLVCACFCSS